MAGGGGLLGNPLLGGLSALFQTLGFNQQSEQARNDSLHQLGGALDISNSLGGMGGGYGEFMGNPYYTPDVMGAMRGLQGSVGQGIYDLGQQTNTTLRNLGQNVGGVYDQQMQDVMGHFNAGAQGLQGNYNSGAQGLMNDYQAGGRGLITDAQNRYNGQMGQFSNSSNDYLKGIDQRNNWMNQTADTRQNQGMALLQGMGDQARSNINQAYTANAGSLGQDLASRGLGNSTIRSSVMTGNERERQNSLGNLDDQLRNQALNTYTGLSGDALATRQTGASTLNNAQGNVLNTQTGLGQSLSGDVLNAQGNVFQGQQGLASNLFQGGQGLAQNLFSSGQGLYGNLYGQGTAARVGNLTDMANASNASGQQALDWHMQSGGNQINQMNNAGSMLYNTLTGTNIQQPQSPWGNIQQMFQGIGSYQGTRDAMAAQQSANLQGMFNPANYMRGGLNYSSAGGLGYGGMLGV